MSGRAGGRFWPPTVRHPDSDETLELLTRSTGAEKRTQSGTVILATSEITNGSFSGSSEEPRTADELMRKNALKGAARTDDAIAPKVKSQYWQLADSLHKTAFSAHSSNGPRPRHVRPETDFRALPTPPIASTRRTAQVDTVVPNITISWLVMWREFRALRCDLGYSMRELLNQSRVFP